MIQHITKQIACGAMLQNPVGDMNLRASLVREIFQESVDVCVREFINETRVVHEGYNQMHNLTLVLGTNKDFHNLILAAVEAGYDMGVGKASASMDCILEKLKSDHITTFSPWMK